MTVEITLPADKAAVNAVLGVVAKSTVYDAIAGSGPGYMGPAEAKAAIDARIGTGPGDIAAGDDSRIAGAEQAANKGMAGGYVPLNSSGKVATSFLPDFIFGAMRFQTTWNAATNVPALPEPSGFNRGFYWVVTVPGATNQGGFTDWKVGDWVVSDGDTYRKVDNTDAVQSVAGLTGPISAPSLATALTGTGPNTLAAGDDARITGAASTDALAAHATATNNPHGVTKAQVGLGSVDNTPDASKPVSAAVQTALDDKATVLSVVAHTNATNNPHNVTKAQVGLGNADNTSDSAKPISTATQAALDLKATASALAIVATTGAYADLSGKPTLGDAAAKNVGTTAGTVAAADDSRIVGAEQAANKGIAGGYVPLDGSGKVSTSFLPDALLGAMRFQTTWNASTNVPALPVPATGNKGFYWVVATAGLTAQGGITDWQVGDWVISDGTTYRKVDNTDAVQSVAGLTGPIAAPSLAAALTGTTANTLAAGDDSRIVGTASALAAHTANSANPHNVTKAQVGLGSVDNTSDAAKPVSTAMQAALDTRASIYGGRIYGNIDVRADNFGGYVGLVSGSPGKPGYVAWYTEDSVRRGYFGFRDDTANALVLNIESGWELNVYGNVNFSNDISAYRIKLNANGTGDAIKVGDDAYIGDVNAAHTVGIKGATDATQGFIKFGSAPSGLGWDGSKLKFGLSDVWTDANNNRNYRNSGITGGGTISVPAYGVVKWSDRFIDIANGPIGGVTTWRDILMPAVGVVIPCTDGTTVTVTSTGIPLEGWASLWFSPDSGLKIIRHNSGLVTPGFDWINVCRHNGDQDAYFFPNGIRLKAGESYSPAQTPWHSYNFNPGTKADLSGATFTGPVSALEMTYDRAINISSTNLNTLTKPGFYNGYALTNAPEDNSADWWYIEVQKHTNGDAYCKQIAHGLTGNNHQFWVRTRENSTWHPWVKVWTSANFDPASKADRNGSNIFTGSHEIRASEQGGIAQTSGGKSGLMISAEGANAATISFHRYGAYAGHLGLDTDNNLRWGGWSLGAVAHLIWHSGNFDPNSKLSATNLDTTRAQIASRTIPLTYFTVSGWTTSGDFGRGATYQRSNPQNGSGLLAIQDASGAWFNLVLGHEANVKHFGCRGDNATDDTAAFQLALTTAISRKVPLKIPGSAPYYLTNKITGGGDFTIRGDGKGLSVLRWPAGLNDATSGLSLTLPRTSDGLTSMGSISGLGIWTGGAATGVGITVTGAADTAPDRITPRLVIRDVLVRGSSSPTVNGWSRGIVLDNVCKAHVDAFTFWGKVNGSEPNYSSLSAISYVNTIVASPHPTEFNIINSYMAYAQTGIDASDFEGGLIRGNQMFGVNTGINANGPDTYPHILIAENHINASVQCIIVDKMYEAMISDNLLYNQLSTGPAGCIDIRGAAQFFSIQNNVIENFNDAYATNAITVTWGANGVIGGNTFRRTNSINGAANGLGIWLTAAASGIRVLDTNKYENTHTNTIDQGALNVVASALPLSGSSTSNNGLETKYGSTVMALDGSGNGFITFPVAFKNALIMAMGSSGDAGYAPGAAFNVNQASSTTSGLAVSVRPNPGAITLRFNWIALGH